MTSTAGNTVAASQGVAVTFDRGTVGLTDPQQIFQVPLGDPARMEAVYFQAFFADSSPNAEAFVLTFAQADGSVVWAQPTPSFTGANDPSIVCTWARGNNDTAQLPGFVSVVIEGSVPAYANPPLPDIVLPALSTISVALWEDSNDNSGSITVENVAVTYTVGTGPTSVTALPDLTPYLLPTTPTG